VNGKFPLVLVALLISSTASLSAAPLTRPERDYVAMMTLSVGVTHMCDGYDVDDANVLRFADSRAINIKRLGSATWNAVEAIVGADYDKCALIPEVTQVVRSVSGLVASLNRPGGNITGVVTLGVEVAPKRLELMHVLLPMATMAVLINPASPTADVILRDLQAAARTLGQSIHVLRASNEPEIDAAFATLVQVRAGSLVIANDAYFNSRTQQFAALTLRYAVPTSRDAR
jgi:hypothetical protein